METPSSELETSYDPLFLIGKLVGGKWRVERVLGEGGMATVYLAVHEHTHRQAAIKVLHPEFCHLREARVRFSREARAANSVNHRGAVPVLDDGELEGGTPYLVMDYLEGESVRDRLDKYDMRLPVDEVLAITERLLDVLEAAHRAGVLHRDIKPDNVFLTNDGEVKLLDFGISKVSAEAHSDKTQVGTLMGTPAYMAPEQARGRWDEIDARSEIFSVGATMFTMLTGRYVHSAETSNELLLEVMSTPARDIRQVAPEVPRALAAIVNRALAFEKKERFESAEQMRAAICALMGRQLRNSQHSFSDIQLSALRPPSLFEETTSRNTYRPVAFSLLPSPTIERSIETARKNWKYGVAMLGVAIVSYFLVVSLASDDAAQLSPVTAIQQASAPTVESPGPSRSAVEADQAIHLSDLPLEEPDDAAERSARKNAASTNQLANSPTTAEGGPTPLGEQKSGPQKWNPSGAPSNNNEAPEAASESMIDPIEVDPLSRRR